MRRPLISRTSHEAKLTIWDSGDVFSSESFCFEDRKRPHETFFFKKLAEGKTWAHFWLNFVAGKYQTCSLNELRGWKIKDGLFRGQWGAVIDFTRRWQVHNLARRLGCWNFKSDFLTDASCKVSIWIGFDWTQYCRTSLCPLRDQLQ